MHRDIRPTNFIYAKKRLYLIDFQFAVCLHNGEFDELKFLIDKPQTIKHLGSDYRKSETEWDDLFSIDKVCSLLG